MDPRVVKALEIEAANLQTGKTSGLNILALRDEFAKAAMAAMLAAPRGKFTHESGVEVARDAYLAADNMLAARSTQ